jgi:hypothetical protein
MRDDDIPHGDGRIRAWLLGAAALAAWMTAVWLIFGDMI